MLVNKVGRIAAYSFSAWGLYGVFLALLISQVSYSIWGVDLNPATAWIAGIAFTIFAFAGRWVNQGIADGGKVRWHWLLGPILVGAFLIYSLANVYNDYSPPIDVKEPDELSAIDDSEDFFSLAVAFIGEKEGLRLEAYLDQAGNPTICYGDTNGVQMGDVKTKEQCDREFVPLIGKYRSGLHGCLQGAGGIPVRPDVGLTSWTFNVGVGAACNSTAVSRLNRGDITGGCQAVGWWNKATINGAKVFIPGLANRRSDEVALCMEWAA